MVLKLQSPVFVHPAAVLNTAEYCCWPRWISFLLLLKGIHSRLCPSVRYFIFILIRKGPKSSLQKLNMLWMKTFATMEPDTFSEKLLVIWIQPLTKWKFRTSRQLNETLLINVQKPSQVIQLAAKLTIYSTTTALSLSFQGLFFLTNLTWTLDVIA